MKQTFLKRSIVGFFAAICVPILVQANQKPPENRVPIEQARKAAISSYPGQIKGEELEFEGGKWIYSFDLTSAKDSRIHEVHVDAISGKFLDKHTETSADESKEQLEESNQDGAD